MLSWPTSKACQDYVKYLLGDILSMICRKNNNVVRGNIGPAKRREIKVCKVANSMNFVSDS